MIAALALIAALRLQVFTASPEGFLVNSTLVSGEKDAILIDADFTLADARKVAEAIQASGKNLTTIYVTHAHPDHYFGAQVIREAFPKAKLVALPAVVAEVQKTWAGKVAQWTPLYKDAITSKPWLPKSLRGTSLRLEGETLELRQGQGDAEHSSYVWIPSIRTAVAGDIVYDGVYSWTAETTPAQRKAWIQTLDQIAALSPLKVVPGHQKAERQQDPSNLEETKKYLAAYDEELAASKTPEELQQKIKARYPDLALDVVLKIGASASFAKK